MRIVYLATADARGHLMRAQLLAHALGAEGVSVQVLTTSDEGAQFLAGFGIEARVLSRHYAVQFDALQNMLRRETDRNVAHYVFRPSRMLRDVASLHRWARDADLLINDSFHPALLFMGCLPRWRHKVVHVYGASLRQALESNFQGRLPRSLARAFELVVAWQIDAARGRIEHDFSYEEPLRAMTLTHCLPTPVAPVHTVDCSSKPRAAVYLNPHFRDPRLAQALEDGIRAAGLQAHCVGEGYAGRPGWAAQDPDWVSVAAASDVLVSAPGMAALAVARTYQRPMVLVLTEQPEQKINAARAAAHGVPHRTVTWRGDAVTFGNEMHAACAAVRLAAGRCAPAIEGKVVAQRRLQAWVSVLRYFAASGKFS